MQKIERRHFPPIIKKLLYIQSYKNFTFYNCLLNCIRTHTARNKYNPSTTVQISSHSDNAGTRSS